MSLNFHPYISSTLLNSYHILMLTQGLEVTSEETQWLQWSEILKNWEDVFPKNTKVVKQLARQGIPEHLRGMAWQLLSDSINIELKEKYPALIIVSPGLATPSLVITV